jgi:hypothetical protein
MAVDEVSSGSEVRIGVAMPTTWSLTLCLVVIALAIYSLFMLADPERSWANFADQELTLAYNAILILSGLRQELYDHNGFVTIYLLSKYIAAKSLVMDGLISQVSQLNAAGSYFFKFQQLVTYSREFAALFSYLMASSIFFMLLLFGLGLISSVLLAIAYVFSTGAMVHFEQLRTEPLSLLLALGSALLFSRSGSATTLGNFGKAVLPFVILILAIVNKIQVMIYCQLYFGAFLFLLTKPSRIATPLNDDVRPNRRLMGVHFLSIALTLSVFILLVSLPRDATNWRSIVIFGMFFLVGGLLVSLRDHALGPQHLRETFHLHIIEFGGLYMAGLVCAFFLVMILSLNPMLFIQVTNPVNLFLYSTHTQASGGLTGDMFSLPLLHAFDPDGTSWHYLAATLVAVTASHRKLEKRDWWALIFFLSACYLIDLTSSIRYLASHYLIYSEVMLLLMLVYFLRKLYNRTLVMLLCAGMLAGSVEVTVRSAIGKLQSNLGQETSYCSNSFIKDWHRRIDHAAFLQECARLELRTLQTPI